MRISPAPAPEYWRPWHDWKAGGHCGFHGRGSLHPRCERRRLSGAVLACHARAPRRRRGGVADDRDEGQRGRDPSLWIHSAEEREWFRLLQTVQNVGARVALNVLSALNTRDLQRAIALSDKAMIGKAQGVGPKLALRIVTELKDKAPSMMLRGPRKANLVSRIRPLRRAAPKPTRSRRLSSSAILRGRRRKAWRASRRIWAKRRWMC